MSYSESQHFFREEGEGPSLLYLHGGWGYEVFPFAETTKALVEAGYRVLSPDRYGYGKSPLVHEFEPGFHVTAGDEMFAFLDAMGIDDVVLWGHSDGAVTAANMAIDRPDRVRALILEAIHLDRAKPNSKDFFVAMVESPELFGKRVELLLQEDHGEDWREVLAIEGRAWLEILKHSEDPQRDLYRGRLAEVNCPTLLLHGRRDPRTEPGEFEEVCKLLDQAEVEVFEKGAHCPHSDPESAIACRERALRFLSSL